MGRFVCKICIWKCKSPSKYWKRLQKRFIFSKPNKAGRGHAESGKRLVSEARQACALCLHVLAS